MIINVVVVVVCENGGKINIVRFHACLSLSIFSHIKMRLCQCILAHTNTPRTIPLHLLCSSVCLCVWGEIFFNFFLISLLSPVNLPPLTWHQDDN